MKFLFLDDRRALSADMEGAGGGVDDAQATNSNAEVASNANTDESEEFFGEDADPNAPPAPPVDDDTEELDLDGEKVRVPKKVKPLLLMQQDYTRKTQEVAEQRRALETQAQSLVQQAQDQQAFLGEIAKVVSVDERIQQYAGLNWQELNAQDPVQAQRLWFEYQALEKTRQNMVGAIEQKAQQKALERQQATAKAIEESHAALAREIPGWGPELAGKLSTFAEGIGFSRAELAGITDPRIVKVLHRAYQGEQLVAKQSAATKPTPKPAPAPVPQVGRGPAPAAKDPERMGTAEWMKWRDSQLRKRG